LIDIYIIHNIDNVVEKLEDTNKVSPFFHLIDDRTKHGKKDSWKIKGHFAAKLTPFIAIYENGNPIKAFYSETGEDVFKSLKSYLNE
jgi:hypothetical protein